MTPEGKRAERRYQLDVQRHLTRNYVALLAHGMLGQTGFRLVNAPTFMPAYLMLLSGGSEFIVGLALSLQALGMTLTPFLAANLIAHRKRVLPVGLISGALMRSTILMIALCGFYLEGQAALIGVLLSMTLLGVFSGMQGVIFNFLNSKIIPVSKRGRLTGLRNFLAGIVSALVAFIAGAMLLGDTPDATGYSWTFLLGFVLTSLGLMMLLAVREPEPPEVRDKQPLGDSLAKLPQLLRDDPAFTRYFLARALATMGRMAMPFYILYAGQSIGLDGPTLGILTIAFTIAATFSNLAWGAIADRTGFRLTFLLSIGLWIAATGLLIFTDGLFMAFMVFIGVGAAVQGFQNSSQNLTLEFGDRADLPTRLAVANTASELAGTIGPLLGGVLAATLGYEWVFSTSVLFLLVGGIVVYRHVPEPRFAKPAL